MTKLHVETQGAAQVEAKGPGVPGSVSAHTFRGGLYLDVLLLLNRHDVGGEERGDKADQQASRCGVERKDDSDPASLIDSQARGTDEQRRARRLAERAEEIRAHARHVTDVVAHVVSNHAGVQGRVLVCITAVNP